MRDRRRIILLLTMAIAVRLSFAQESLIQFSGLVLSSDSLQPLPYANIYLKNTHSGTTSNLHGFFSLVAKRTDTVVFSMVGFKRSEFVIPDTLSTGKYSVIQLLTWDTIHLAATVVYPWPSREHFREAFLKADIPDDDLERARKNLEREKLKELGEAMGMDADEILDLSMRQHAARFYSAGQVPYRVFDPITGGVDLAAIMRFIEAWKRGDFKRKKKDKGE